MEEGDFIRSVGRISCDAGVDAIPGLLPLTDSSCLEDAREWDFSLRSSFPWRFVELGLDSAMGSGLNFGGETGVLSSGSGPNRRAVDDPGYLR